MFCNTRCLRFSPDLREFICNLDLTINQARGQRNLESSKTAMARWKTRKFRNPNATVIIHYTNKQSTPRVPLILLNMTLKEQEIKWLLLTILWIVSWHFFLLQGLKWNHTWRISFKKKTTYHLLRESVACLSTTTSKHSPYLYKYFLWSDSNGSD